MAISKIGSDGLASGSTTPSALSTGAPSWDSSGNLSFNSGYGSVATAYGCRAWVNFNGTGTVAIRASGNVSSITDLGTGSYRINFSNAMPDTNYSTTTAFQRVGTADMTNVIQAQRTTTYDRVEFMAGGSQADPDAIYASIFR